MLGNSNVAPLKLGNGYIQGCVAEPFEVEHVSELPCIGNTAGKQPRLVTGTRTCALTDRVVSGEASRTRSESRTAGVPVHTTSNKCSSTDCYQTSLCRIVSTNTATRKRKNKTKTQLRHTSEAKRNAEKSSVCVLLI